ncbi:MAG: hypothetical protein IT288_17595 [Bdellovibrionales bacterium]|nr:hypothetical protein [Bdellovibrionales bacterium]
MLEEATRLIDEVCQIRAQYMDEVGSGRRAWPRSIKERMAKLDKLGLPAKAVSDRTGIPYGTILLWRHRRNKSGRSNEFHELSVKTETKLPAISKTMAVTVPSFEMRKNQEGLRLTTPDGFVIEGLDSQGVVAMIQAFSGRGRHAS